MREQFDFNICHSGVQEIPQYISILFVYVFVWTYIFVRTILSIDLIRSEDFLAKPRFFNRGLRDKIWFSDSDEN